MNISIIGMGYVGLVAGVCFAEMGHIVAGLDIDEKKISELSAGRVPLHEPGLKELLERNLKERRISFTTSYAIATKASPLIFLALPTPPGKDGSADLSYIFSAAREIAKHMNSYTLLVNKSTAPVGTLIALKNYIEKILRERQSDCSFDIGSNPEFLKEGTALQDFLKPDRIIIGSESAYVRKTLTEIYSGFTLSRDRIMHMSIAAAELTKYVANAMLSCRISFMNEIAALCDGLGVNVQEVRRGIGSDSRIGSAFLYPGVGFGGSCFPKDLSALMNMARGIGVSPHMLEAIWKVNESQKGFLYTKLCELFASTGLSNKVIAIWGLSFKPDTDDMREAPSLSLIKSLIESGASLQLFDPVAMEKAKSILPSSENVIFCESEKLAATGADAICLLTEWKQFRYINMQEIYLLMRQKYFLDGRNQYCPKAMRKLGFTYLGIGTSESNPPIWDNYTRFFTQKEEILESDLSACGN